MGEAGERSGDHRPTFGHARGWTFRSGAWERCHARRIQLSPAPRARGGQPYWLHYGFRIGLQRLRKTWPRGIVEHAARGQAGARILFLEGQPNMQSLDQLRIGEAKDRMRSRGGRAPDTLPRGGALCDTANDRVSKSLEDSRATKKNTSTSSRPSSADRPPRRATLSQKHVGELE